MLGWGLLAIFSSRVETYSRLLIRELTVLQDVNKRKSNSNTQRLETAKISESNLFQAGANFA